MKIVLFDNRIILRHIRAMKIFVFILFLFLSIFISYPLSSFKKKNSRAADKPGTATPGQFFLPPSQQANNPLDCLAEQSKGCFIKHPVHDKADKKKGEDREKRGDSPVKNWAPVKEECNENNYYGNTFYGAPGPGRPDQFFTMRTSHFLSEDFFAAIATSFNQESEHIEFLLSFLNCETDLNFTFILSYLLDIVKVYCICY